MRFPLFLLVLVSPLLLRAQQTTMLYDASDYTLKRPTAAQFKAANSLGTVSSVSVTTANGVSGSVANATTTPAITLTLGAITPTSVNGLTLTSSTGTLTIASAKTFTASNTLTLAGTDGSTLNIGTGGTLGSNAFTSTAYVPQTTTVAGNALSGNITQDQITGLASTGLVKRSAANTLAIATSGTDYAPATSGSAILAGNGSGGFSSVTIGTGLQYSGGTLSNTASAPTAANPTASVGLSAVNGSASTYMRSDAAPALSEGIVPNWGGLHTWLPNLGASSGTNYVAKFMPTYAQSGTAGSTDILINRTNTSLGSGTHNFVDYQVGNTTYYSVGLGATLGQTTVTLVNPGNTDTQGARKSYTRWMGYKADGTLHTLAQISAYHASSSANQEGEMDLLFNTGSEGTSPTGGVQMGSNAAGVGGSFAYWSIDRMRFTTGSRLFWNNSTWFTAPSDGIFLVSDSGGNARVPIGSAPRTITGATYSIVDTDHDVICNRAGGGTLTLGTATNGREIYLRTITADAWVSASSNVVPLAGGAASTAILSATAGKWVRLVGDGTNFQIMAGN